MAYIITGSTGHIGNNLIRELVKLNKNVKILTRRIDKSIENYETNCILGDIFNREFLVANIHKGDIVVHLAGVIDIKNNKKEETLKINYEGTRTILDVSIDKKVKQFIYFSTTDCIYKENEDIIKEPSIIYPEKFKDNYSYSKALATKYVMEQRTKHQDIKINILYPSAVIGVNDYKPSSIGKVVKDIIDCKMQFGIKGGYNFVDVDDVIKATINLLEKELNGDYLLTGHFVSIVQFYDVVNQVLRRKRRTIKIPTFIVYIFMPFIPYLSKFVIKTINEKCCFDNNKMQEKLGVQNTEFYETINKTVMFFKNNH